MEFEYMPFYPKNFLASRNTLRMNAEAIGAYLLMLLESWRETDAEGPHLKEDAINDSELMDIMRVDSEGLQRVKSKVLKCFERQNGRLINSFLVSVWEDVRERHEKAVHAGRKGGKAKASTAKQGSSTATAPLSSATNSASTAKGLLSRGAKGSLSIKSNQSKSNQKEDTSIKNQRTVSTQEQSGQPLILDRVSLDLRKEEKEKDPEFKKRQSYLSDFFRQKQKDGLKIDSYPFVLALLKEASVTACDDDREILAYCLQAQARAEDRKNPWGLLAYMLAQRPPTRKRPEDEFLDQAKQIQAEQFQNAWDRQRGEEFNDGN